MTGLATNSEYLKQSDLLNKRTGEPQAFELLRSFGQKFLATQNWPIRKDENWRYTSTQIFSSQQFTPGLIQKKDLTESIKKLILATDAIKAFSDSLDIVFIDGVYTADFTISSDNNPKVKTAHATQTPTSTGASSEVRVLNLKSAIEKGLYPIFDLSKPLNSFEALNLSFLEEGVFIDIPEHTDVKSIINLVFISTQNDEQTLSLPRIVINVGSSAHLTLVESYSGLGSSSTSQWTNSQVEIHMQSKARLAWARLQKESETQLHTCRTKIYLAEGAELHSLLIAQGASLYRHDLNIEIKGENTSANVHGISLGTNKEHRDSNTLINFKSGNSKAQQIFKSILHGESKSIFNGKIIIQPDSQKVDSSQLNQSLILSEKAEANSQPQLEIYADDVKATHGATIGQLNEEELFYFKSRGISELKAKLMLTQGFAIDLVDRFPNEEVRTLLHQNIKTKLQGFW